MQSKFDTYNPSKEDLVKYAPEGATHYSPENKHYFFCWYKKDAGGLRMFKYTDDNEFYNDSWKEDVDEQVCIEIPSMKVDDTDVNQGVPNTLGNSVESPVTIRERILEIRKQREAGVKEEQNLIDILASMGFKLIDEINEKLEEAEDPHDLQDPKNWKAGDLVQRVSDLHPTVYTPGGLYEVKAPHPWLTIYDNFDDNGGCKIETWEYSHFKFHSRPTK